MHLWEIELYSGDISQIRAVDERSARLEKIDAVRENFKRHARANKTDMAQYFPKNITHSAQCPCKLDKPLDFAELYA